MVFEQLTEEQATQLAGQRGIALSSLDHNGTLVLEHGNQLVIRRLGARVAYFLTNTQPDGQDLAELLQAPCMQAA